MGPFISKPVKIEIDYQKKLVKCISNCSDENYSCPKVNTRLMIPGNAKAAYEALMTF